MNNKPKTSFNLITSEEAANELREYAVKRSDGDIKSLLTPWKSLNKRGINGCEWGTINTIGGMSGAGKTAVASILETNLFELNPAENFACLNLTFEMKASKLIGRKISSKLKVTTSELYSGERKFDDFVKLDEYLEDIKKHEIYYLEDYTTVKGIKNVFSQLYHHLNPDAKDKPIHEHKGLVLFLDHSILVKKDKESNRLEALHALCEMFNELKKQFKCMFFILTQLNRSIESAERRDESKNQILHFPTKADIYGGDSLYQFSDIVLIIHRPEILNIMYYGPNGWPSKDRIFYHYLKVREGDPGVAIMKNDLKNNKIVEE